MTSFRYEHRHQDVACELDKADAGTRAREWAQLRDEHGLSSEAIPAGVRLWLRAEGRHAAEDLARREAACCGFLDLEVADDGDRVRVDITSPAADAGPVIACLVGTELAPPCC